MNLQIDAVLIETYWNVKVESLRVFPALEVLIETYWNVKFSAAISFSDVVCINRNILECKEPYRAKIQVYQSVLIETYWNVKANIGYNIVTIFPY